MHRTKYQTLLDRFAGNIDLLDLIEECILEDKGEREVAYLNSRKYPEQRDLIMKLKTDLIMNTNKER